MEKTWKNLMQKYLGFLFHRMPSKVRFDQSLKQLFLICTIHIVCKHIHVCTYMVSLVDHTIGLSDTTYTCLNHHC